MISLSDQMENWDRDNHPSDCESYVPAVRKLERQIAELTAERDSEKQRADRLDTEGDRLAKDWGQATAALTVKTLEWEGERKAIEQIESWLGADCRGSLGTGIKAAIDRFVAERDQLRAALEAVEWTGRTLCGNSGCGHCGAAKVYGHAPDCIVGLALERKA